MSDSEGFDNICPGEARAGEALAGPFNMLVLPGIVFFGVTLISEPPFPTAIFCLDDGSFSLVGVSLDSRIEFVGRDEADATDMRDWDGRRSLGTGCAKKSPASPEDDCDGDRE